MKRNLKLFWFFSLYSMKQVAQHRTGVIFFLFGKIFRFFMFFIFIYILLTNTQVLAGYTLVQTLVFFLTFNVLDTLAQLLFREVYRFRPLIVTGEFDGVLVKPYHPLLRVLIGGIDVLDLIMLVPYVAILSFFVLKAQTATSFSYLIYFLLLGNAMLIATAFHILVLALGILTTEVDHTVMIYRDMTRMAAVPVDIYRQPLRTAITFVIPVGIMMTFPVKGLFNSLNWQLILISFVIGIGLFLFSLWSWRTALRKYQSWGS